MRYKHDEKRSKLKRANEWLTWKKVPVIALLIAVTGLMIILPICYILNRQIDAEQRANEIEYQYKIRRVGETPEGL